MLEVSQIISGIAYFLLYSYLFSKILNENTFKLNSILITMSLISTIIDYIIIKLNLGYIRPYVIHIIILIMLKIYYKKPIVKTLIIFLLMIIVTFASEAIFGLMFVLLINVNPKILMNNWLYYLLINFLIFSTSIFIIKIKKINNFMTNIINWYSKNEFKSLLIFAFFVLIIITFFLYNNFIKFLPSSLLWIMNLFCVGVFIFIIGFFKEKTNNNKIVSEYDQLLNYVKTYEKLLEEKSKTEHEYKNQMLVIKSLISAKDKEAIKYIDKHLNSENKQLNQEWLNKLKNIPQGGLKGLIYYKIEEMLFKNINIYVDISKELEKANLNNYFHNLYDISKIIGVYLDNAIEASMNSKEKYIILEIFVENEELIFKISNTYSNNIDLNKIDNEGYTTKGKGKGYGLSLVKDLLTKNKNFEQTREFNGMYYVQMLNIKK